MKDWKSKLASRKFWSAVVGFAVAIAAAFGADEMTTAQISAIITAAGVLVAYIFAESYVDASHSGAVSGDAEQPSSEKKK